MLPITTDFPYFIVKLKNGKKKYKVTGQEMNHTYNLIVSGVSTFWNRDFVFLLRASLGYGKDKIQHVHWARSHLGDAAEENGCKY